MSRAPSSSAESTLKASTARSASKPRRPRERVELIIYVDEVELRRHRWIITNQSLDLRFQARQCRNPPVDLDLADCVALQRGDDCHTRGSFRVVVVLERVSPAIAVTTCHAINTHRRANTNHYHNHAIWLYEAACGADRHCSRHRQAAERGGKHISVQINCVQCCRWLRWLRQTS